MTGWRIAWAAGNREAIEVLGRFKSNVDSGVFQAIQYAAIEGLEGPQDSLLQMQKLYAERRDAGLAGLKKIGLEITPPKGTFYLWVPVPEGYNSSDFAEAVLEKANVIITPGLGYGEYGEGYFRIALTVDQSRLEEAFERIYTAFGKF